MPTAAKQNQTTPAKPDKASKPAAEPAVTGDLSAAAAGLATMPGGPVNVAGDGSIQTQAGRLSDPHFQTAQRCAKVAQVGRLQGNHHLVNVLSLIPEKPQVSLEPDLQKIPKAHPFLTRVAKTVQTWAIQRDNGPTGGAPATSPDFVSINHIISTASARFPNLEPRLRLVTFKAVIQSDRTNIQIDGVGTRVYPTSIVKAQAGFYLYKCDAAGKYQTIPVDLETGAPASEAPLIHEKVGSRELKTLRRNGEGVVQITQTVVLPPQPPQPTMRRPEDMEFPLESYPEQTVEEVRRFRETYPESKLKIPGLTGGEFAPEHNYERPLNLKYYTHDGVQALVSRVLIGREYFFVVEIQDIQKYLRFYPFEFSGLAAAPMVARTQMLVEIGLGFVPIVGPLWSLAMVARDVYYASQNWNRMSGWEKTLVGLNVLLTAIPVIKAGRNIVRGSLAFREGVNTMVARGLPKAEATRLMIAAGVFQSERATRQIVSNLGDALIRGERMTAGQIAQIERVLNQMIARLPAAERAVFTATYATQSLSTVRQFLKGVELTEEHMVGLRRLMPQVLVALKKAARTEPVLVERVARMAAKSESVAQGIDKIALTVKPGHLTSVVTELGEELLAKIGSGEAQISDNLVKFVQRARSAGEAYRRLMVGSARGRRPIAGLVATFERTRPDRVLPPGLVDIRNEFSHTFLTIRQLAGLSRLSPEIRMALKQSRDIDLRTLATMAEQSIHAAEAVNNLASKLLAANLPTHALSKMLANTGAGLLEMLGRSGAQLSEELLGRVARVAKRGNTTAAQNTLLRGFTRSKAAAGRHIAGLIEVIAGTLPTRTSLELGLSSVEMIGSRAELFAEWAIKNSSSIEGIETIIRLRGSDAQAKIAGIYRAFASNHDTVIDVLRGLKTIETQSRGALGLERMVGELAAGGSKTMGASLTLQYAVQKCGGQVTAFERRVTKSGVTRDYDLVARGFQHEFKYWLGIGGEPMRAAMVEFEKDVILNVEEGFRGLRWVFSKDVEGGRAQLESLMRGVLSRRRVLQFLRDKGISLSEAERRLETALQGWLIDFI